MRRSILLAGVLIIGAGSDARAQTVDDTLSFLLTNRSIPTADPARDEAAALSARDTISRLLLLELATVPTVSSSTGFIYQMDRDLGGTVVRSSESFGPTFVERSLTVGTIKPAFGVSFQETRFSKIDGRSLSDGTLVAIGSRLAGQTAPYDVETLSLRLRTRTLTLSTNVGVTDRLDVSASLPIVRLTLSGERIDTLRGAPLLQATAAVDASGVGDLIVRAKYNVVRRGGTGVAVGVETRLPTGDTENLLGAGEPSVKPRVIGSIESARVSVHGELGYASGGLSRELDYGAAVAITGSPRVTVVGELLGRRLDSGSRLVESVTAHPTLVGIETIRLTSVDEATHRTVAAGTVKWNIAQTWLLSATLQRPLTDVGLTSTVVPSVSLEYSFGR
jgi:hypothetical protein